MGEQVVTAPAAPAPSGQPPVTTPPTAPAQNPPTPQAPVQTPNPTAPTQDQQAVKAAAESAGLDYEAIVGEFRQNGAISEKTRATVKTALEKIGLPANVADSYFANLDAAQALFMHNVYQVTGGEDGYHEMAAWAREALSAKEIKTFSDMASSSDPEQALMAVKLLHGRYQQEAMLGGTRLKATAGSGAPTDTFKDMSEYAAALADPKYTASPTYREEVTNKLRRSMASGAFKPY